MNKFKEFVKWVIETPDNKRADLMTRLLSLILVLSTALLVICTACVGIILLVRHIILYPVIIAVLVFVVIPSYLWVKFYKGESK